MPILGQKLSVVSNAVNVYSDRFLYIAERGLSQW